MKLITSFLVTLMLFSSIVGASQDENREQNTSAEDKMQKNTPKNVSVEGGAFSGTFIQTKKLKALKRPFKSQGEFKYIAGKGLWWKTQSPVKSTKLFTAAGVYSVDEKGNKTLEIKMDNDFFFVLFAGDKKELARYFIVKEQSSCLVLLPKEEALSSLFQEITLCLVDDIPEKIILSEDKESQTVIELKNIKSLINSGDISFVIID